MQDYYLAVEKFNENGMSEIFLMEYVPTNSVLFK